MLYVEENYVNATERHNAGNSGIYESFTDSPGDLYRAYIRDGNRCIGKVYIDTGTPNRPRAIGWVFLKRMKYEDSPETFLLETWVTLHDAHPDVTRTCHYHTLKGR